MNGYKRHGADTGKGNNVNESNTPHGSASGNSPLVNMVMKSVWETSNRHGLRPGAWYRTDVSRTDSGVGKIVLVENVTEHSVTYRVFPNASPSYTLTDDIGRCWTWHPYDAHLAKTLEWQKRHQATEQFIH
jgi:hypothetical protein